MTKKVEIVIDEMFSPEEIIRLSQYRLTGQTRGKLDTLTDKASAIIADGQTQVLDQEDKTIRIRPAVLSKAKRIVR